MKKTSIVIILVFWVIIFGEIDLYSKVYTPADLFNNVSLKTIQSKILNEKRKLYIYLPKGSKTNKYPVLFLLDGGVMGLYKEALEVVKHKPHIIVGIDTYRNRNRDMIPVKIASRLGSGGSDKFLDFLVQELLPFIKKNYLTNGRKILSGNSNSGLFTIYAMLTKPGAFFAYISISPTIGYCPDFLKKKVIQISSKGTLKGKILYIRYGKKDFLKKVTDFIPSFGNILKDKLRNDLSFFIEVLPDGGHVPQGSIIKGINFIYK